MLFLLIFFTLLFRSSRYYAIIISLFAAFHPDDMPLFLLIHFSRCRYSFTYDDVFIYYDIIMARYYRHYAADIIIYRRFIFAACLAAAAIRDIL